MTRLTVTCAEFLSRAGELFAADVIEGVTLTDREPSPWVDDFGRKLWGWYYHWPDVHPEPDNLPHRIHRLLPTPFYREGSWTYYASRAEALAALSAACVAYARSLTAPGA